MTVAAAPDDALVLAAVELVWGSMLYAPLEPWPLDRRAGLESGLQAQIELRGEWSGRLVLTCDRVVAGEIAAAMLGTSLTDELPEDDVHDAVGEVLNVVGGSVKGALGGVTALGLPEVIRCADVPVADVAFVIAWNESPVYVQIIPDAA